MRAPPKKYYGSHTTSTYTASTGEDVPDATPRRKLIGFLHRTSHLSLTSEATDENSLHIAGQTSSCYESEEDRSKHDTDKNYFSSDGTDISFKQDFRAKTLRTHRNMNVVLNMKTNDFLGISLIGQASYNCDKGIFIADIMSGGAVAQNGRISIGDELLEVNGNSFLHFSNDQAVELLKNEILKRGPIRLKISKRFPTIAANPLVSKSFGSLKRDGLTRKSLHVSPSYRGTDMQLDEQVWVPQKSSSMRDVMRHLNPTQTMMPAIKETHENPNSISPSALRRQTPVKSSRKNSIRSSNGKQYNMDSDKEDVVQAMCLPNSYLEAKERTWLKITHPMCFLGKHLLDWLLSNVEGMNDRRVAKMYAFELLQEKLIVHVICRYTFSEQCYYVFGEEIEKKKKERESNAECSYMI
uniref:PDZ domain-containing protein n=1 Tax=Rhabditophanes sp. KR3021 TaxID=114890 RepID=A0AC35U4N9_9BILA